jgi:hypothetical protein
MSKISILLIFVGLAISCEYNNTSNCYHGKVIMTSCCSGSTFITLDLSTPMGINTKLNGQEYSNVIQVPGYLNQNQSVVYMNLRKYDPGKDSNLFAPIRCYCLIAVGTDVPLFVATALSYSSCPRQGLKK